MNEAIERAVERYRNSKSKSDILMARESLVKLIHLYGMSEYHRGYEDGRKK